MAATDTSAPDNRHEPDGSPGWRAAWPFFIAVGIVVIALGTIGLFHVIRPGSERLTDTAKVTHAINDYYTAKNAVNYANFRDASCPADLLQPTFPSAEAFKKIAQTSRDDHGTIVVTDITETTVTGSSATANMHWHYTRNAADQVQPMALVKLGDDFKVCGAKGP